MSDCKAVKSIEELFAYVNELEQGAEFQPIKLDGTISLTLHIEGQSWDGRVDKRTAQYVVELQKAFELILEEYAPEAVSQDILIKVDSKEGSWNSIADITEILDILVSKMTDMQAFGVIIAGIGLIGGYWYWNRYQTRKEHVEIEQERTKIEKEHTKQEEIRNKVLLEAFQALEKRIDPMFDNLSVYERPIRSLVKTLDDSDAITIGDTAERIPAFEAKKCGPKRAPRSEEILTYADGNYTVNAICYDEGEVVLVLEQNGQTIKAYLSQFDEEDRKVFRESLNKHEQEDELPFSMDLQLNVVHTKKRLKHAFVINEGAPREGKSCLSLSQIVEKQPR